MGGWGDMLGVGWGSSCSSLSPQVGGPRGACGCCHVPARLPRAGTPPDITAKHPNSSVLAAGTHPPLPPPPTPPAATENAVLQLLGKGAPRLLESQLDSKKELERALKATCEALIMHFTKLTVEPMLSFITKVTAVRVATAAGGGGGGGEAAAAAPSKPLREQVCWLYYSLVWSGLVWSGLVWSGLVWSGLTAWHPEGMHQPTEMGGCLSSAPWCDGLQRHSAPRCHLPLLLLPFPAS